MPPYHFLVKPLTTLLTGSFGIMLFALGRSMLQSVKLWANTVTVKLHSPLKCSRQCDSPFNSVSPDQIVQMWRLIGSYGVSKYHTAWILLSVGCAINKSCSICRNVHHSSQIHTSTVWRDAPCIDEWMWIICWTMFISWWTENSGHNAEWWLLCPERTRKSLISFFIYLKKYFLKTHL